MNEDPTRIMSSGGGRERRRPSGGRPPQRPHGNVRLLIALMGAVIFGLLIALFVVSCSGGGTETVTITTEPEYVEPKQPVSPGNEEKETPAEEEEHKAEAEVEELENETGGLEEGGLEGEEGLEGGGIEEVAPEGEEGLEGGGIEEVAPEEPEGGGVPAG